MFFQLAVSYITSMTLAFYYIDSLTNDKMALSHWNSNAWNSNELKSMLLPVELKYLETTIFYHNAQEASMLLPNAWRLPCLIALTSKQR